MLESMRESSIQYTWNYFVSAQGTPSLDMPDTLSDSEKRKFDVMRFVLQDAYSSRYIANRLF